MATSFDDLRAANPYKNQEYKKSGWQNFLSSLGFRTQADAWKENMSVQAAEFDAALAQKEFDTEYNSAQAQTARLKQAGLNPDLNPSMVDAGDAGSMGQDMSTPMQSTGEESVITEGAKLCLDTASMIMSGFTSGLGLVTTLQGIHFNKLNNSLAALNNESAFQDFVGKNWMTFLPDSPEDEVMVNDFDWKAQALKNAQMFSGQLPRKFQKKFVDSVSRYWESAPGSAEAYKVWRDRVNSRRGFYTDYQTTYSDIDNVLKDITEPLGKLASDVLSQSLKTEKRQLVAGEKQASNEAEYFSELDATQQAQAENTSNEVQTTNNKMVAELNKTLEQIVSNLKKHSEDGGIPGALSQMALVAVAAARLWLSSQGAPSISRSSSVAANGATKSSFKLDF